MRSHVVLHACRMCCLREASVDREDTLNECFSRNFGKSWTEKRGKRLDCNHYSVCVCVCVCIIV